MTDSTQSENPQQPKKISLADAVRNKLAQKKQAQSQSNKNFGPQENQVLKSQMTKKVNNQRRRTGGS
ncbi:Uncharacterised protein [Chlamydia abortus]|uniref:DUF5302 domain-containing protein n=1 Tax=Paenibacillus residui TaxID=629724 RepID=A0ABW3D4R6_9BACL|nr:MULTISPECIES: hypothetical protein [Paenibacillaceae]SHE14024.1 Uncharacterised protein [Chlamydia abortus]